MTQIRIRFRREHLWPFLVAATIIIASTRSQVAAPQVSNFDKYAHFSVYGLLATLLCRLGKISWRSALWAVLATSIFGVTDEWHQSFVPGRSCEIGDWVADTSGAALAVTLYIGWSWYRRLLEAPLVRSRQKEIAGDR
jgi:VanZ family protein